MALRKNEKHCITRDCKFYFQSDHIERCGLTGIYLTRKEKKTPTCLNYIQSKIEEITCSVAKQMEEINYLEDLKVRMNG